VVQVSPLAKKNRPEASSTCSVCDLTQRLPIANQAVVSTLVRIKKDFGAKRFTTSSGVPLINVTAARSIVAGFITTAFSGTPGRYKSFRWRNLCQTVQWSAMAEETDEYQAFLRKIQQLEGIDY